VNTIIEKEINYLEKFDTKYHFLGSLCLNKHDHNGLKQSIRGITSNNCIQCANERRLENPEKESQRCKNWRNRNLERAKEISKNSYYKRIEESKEKKQKEKNIKWFENFNFKLNNHVLGSLCDRKHDHTGNGESLRFKTSNNCVQCFYEPVKIEKIEKIKIKKTYLERFDSKKHFIGKLCENNHDHTGNGESIRLLNLGSLCIECRTLILLEGKRKSEIKQIPRKLSKGIASLLKGNKNNIRWEEFVDYTASQAKEHLKQYLPYVFIDNNFSFELDHIIPLSWFVIEEVRDLEFNLCCSLQNLQLLTRKDNQTKHASFAGSHKHKIITDKEFKEMLNYIDIETLCKNIWLEYSILITEQGFY
jgi:hypothetical protein